MVKKCIACNGLLDNDLYCRNCRLVNPDFKKGKPFYSNFSRRAEKGSVSRKMLMLLLSCAILIVSYVALPSFVNFVEKSWAGIVYIVVVPGVFILVAIGLARLLSKKCPDCGSAEVDLTSNKTLRRTHKYKSTIVHTHTSDGRSSETGFLQQPYYEVEKEYSYKCRSCGSQWTVHSTEDETTFRWW